MPRLRRVDRAKGKGTEVNRILLTDDSLGESIMKKER
jgi:hypothetical protein